MAYTTIKKPSDYFNTITYTGDGSASRSLTGVNFQPDFIWGKSLSAVRNHHLFDSIRGGNKLLKSNSTDAETVDPGSGYIGSFDSDGFTAISGSSDNNNFNNNSENYVAWNWLASNTTASNTDGSITSTVSANTTNGFSIVSYTGTGANATVGHGLGSLPGMVIVKGRNTTATNHWFVFHQNSQSSYSASGSAILLLNATNAVDTIGVGGVWNNTSPTSSVFNIGTANGVNESGKDFIAYCFADVKGFSKFGSYVGNGSTDGTFVYTGFKPAWVMVKSTTLIKNWYLIDNKRENYNPNYETSILFANSTNAEQTLPDRAFDFLSNGFKLRGSDNDVNGSGSTYIYMAFAEEPLVGDNPATAR